MKIWTQCECILLNESLKMFLGSMYAPKNECDFIISDVALSGDGAGDKPVFLIANGGHIAEPFTKNQLFSNLYNFHMSLGATASQTEPLSELEAAVGELVDDFKYHLIKLLRTKA